MKTRNFVLALGFCLASFLALTGCKEEAVDQSDVCAKAAKTYYDGLLRGNYAQFVDAHFRPDSIPASYRLQLIDNAKMYIGQQDDEHQGIKSVAIANAKADTLSREGEVYLLLSYGDKSREEIYVPMTYVAGHWYMK